MFCRSDHPDTAEVDGAASAMLCGRIRGGPQLSLSQKAKVTGSSATAHLKEYTVDYWTSNQVCHLVGNDRGEVLVANRGNKDRVNKGPYKEEFLVIRGYYSGQLRGVIGRCNRKR